MVWWENFCLVFGVLFWVYSSADMARGCMEPEEPTWKAVWSSFWVSVVVTVVLLLAGTGAIVLWQQLQAVQ